MNKSKLSKHLSSRRGSDFLSINDVCASLAIGKAAAYALLDGLDFIPIGNAKKYFVGDIAERLDSEKRR